MANDEWHTLTRQFFPRAQASTLFFVAVALVSVAFGVILRFATLDYKLFTNDEATTSLRVAGHRTADYIATFDGHVRSTHEIVSTMQGRMPGTTPLDVARALAIEEPQHAPLYYISERAWQNLAGDGVRARRTISALAGSALILAAAWLAFEIFGLNAAAVVATLIALSPFHLIYAQQAREYALWALLVAFVTVLFVRALRDNTLTAWSLYSIGTTLGLYTDSLFLATVLAHGITIVATKATRTRLGIYLLAAGSALIAYSPWLWFLIAHARIGGINTIGSNTYLQTPLSFRLFVAKWLFQIAAVFFDSEYRSPQLGIVAVLVIAIVAVASVRISRQRTLPSNLILYLGLIPSVMLIIPDILLHQSRSTAARYLIPSWLSIELAVSWLIAQLITTRVIRNKIAAYALFTFLTLAGALASFFQATTNWSWADASIKPIGPVARILDSATVGGSLPLVLWQAPFGTRGAPNVFDFSVVELSDVLTTNVRFQQFAWGTNVQPTATKGLIFLLNPTDRLRRRMTSNGYKLKLSYKYDSIGSGLAASAHRESARLRKSVGFLEVNTSLWQLKLHQ